jgi:5'-deoxynucleotidase YfbR-like HD superfamily hydrolase
MARKNPQPERAWQRMLSGRRLDLIDPSPVDIEIEDIAHGLARVARWNGQTRGEHAFSVAQHCLLVLDFVRRAENSRSSAELMMALLHDAPEYVVGDMISPFKAVIGGDYKAVEERLLSAIHIRFGLPALTPPAWKKAIKRADAIAAWHEATSLAGFSSEEADRFFPHARGMEASASLLEPMSPRDAQSGFLDAFRLLDAARGADGARTSP